MTGKTRIMVTGAAGQLGSTVVTRLSATCDVFAFTRAALDLADAPAVLAAMTTCSPNVVINCAAYNDVEAAEDAAAAALSGNALAVQALARAAAATGATLIHYGTDFVFDGTADRPYVETDACRPLSTYGMSKLLGEWFALEAPGAYVLRVESLFGGQSGQEQHRQDHRRHPRRPAGPRLRGSHGDAELCGRRGFGDRTDHSPHRRSSCARRLPLRQQRRHDLARHRRGDRAPARRDAELIPVKSTEVKLKAKRPVYCALSNEKLKDAGIVMPTWQEALGRYIGSRSAVESEVQSDSPVVSPSHSLSLQSRARLLSLSRASMSSTDDRD